MARPLRIDLPDGVYHVTSRGLERREIVRDDRDRRKWLSLLDQVARQRRWQVFAWALMDNHFHLFLRTPGPDLSAGMHDLNSGYASAFNRRHGRCGPLLQGRFKGILVEAASHEWELSRYVHLNPVRAGLVARPEAYAWSSCRFYLGEAGAPEWLAWEEVLARHGRTLAAARRAYIEYLAEGVAAPPESPLRGVVASTLLGSADFVARMRAWLQGRLPDREVPAARALRVVPSAEAIEATVCDEFGARPEGIRKPHAHGNDARAIAIYLCRRSGALSLAAVGERFGGLSGAGVSKTCARLSARLARDRRLARRLDACATAAEDMSNVKT